MKSASPEKSILSSVPDFILDRYKTGKYSGSFEGAVFYADISDFTKMTETLMKRGKKGAEELSSILNRFFGPFINGTYSVNGFVSCLEGDSIITVFPSFSCEKAKVIDTVINAHKKFSKIKPPCLKKISRGISVKAGFSYGKIDWQIVHKHSQYAYFFMGEAVSGAISAGIKSSENEINFDRGSKDFLPFGKADFVRCRHKMNLHDPALSAVEDNNRQDDILREMFMSHMLRGRMFKNEFRDVITCFVSPHQGVDISGFVGTVSRLSEKYCCYARFSYGDKGVVSVAVFGAPVRMEDSFERACGFASELSKTGLYKIGLTYGSAFAGIIGNNTRAEYVVLGEKVNLAARLMSRVKTREIFVDFDLSDAAKEIYNFKYRGEGLFKGFLEPCKYYGLMKKKFETRPENVELTGMKKEVFLLTDELKKFSHEKNFRVISIFGDVGAGKTVLIKKSLEKAGVKDAVFISPELSNFEDFGVVSKFYESIFIGKTENKKFGKKLFNRKFSDYVQITTKNSDKSTASKWQDELSRAKPLISYFISSTDNKSFIKKLNYKTMREETIRATAAVLKSFCLRKPSVLVIDDAHNLDEQSKEVFSEALEKAGNLSLCLILCSRYAGDGSRKMIFKTLKGKRALIDVKRLSPAEISDLAERFFGSKLSKQFSSYLFSTTRGNPYFLATYCDFLKKSGLFETRDNKAYLKKETQNLPGSIKDVIIAKIDRLENDAKDILFSCSVFRKRIEVSILSDIHKVRRNRMYGLLEELIEKGFLAAKGRKEVGFQSDIISKAVYGMMLESEIARRHSAAARSIQDKFREKKNYFEEIAYHLDKANDLRMSAEYFVKAARYDKERLFYKRAVELYSKAKKNLRRQKDPIKTVMINLELSEIHSKAGEILLSKKNLLENIKICKKVTEKEKKVSLKRKIAEDLLFKTYYSLGDDYIVQGKYGKAIETAKLSLKIAQKPYYRQNKHESYNLLGRIHYYKNNYSKALYYYKKSIGSMISSGGSGDDPRIFMNIANVYSETGDYDKAISYYRRSQRISEKLGDRITVSNIKFNTAYLYFEKKNYKKSLRYFNECLAFCRKFRLHSILAKTYLNIGLLYMDLRDLRKSRRCFSESLKLNRKIDDPLETSRVLNNFGSLMIEKQDYKSAEKYFKEALDIKDRIGDEKGKGILLGNLGKMHTQMKNYKEAEKYLLESAEIFRKLGVKFLLAMVLVYKLELHSLRGDRTFPEKTVAEAISLARRLKNESLKKQIENFSGRS